MFPFFCVSALSLIAVLNANTPVAQPPKTAQTVSTPQKKSEVFKPFTAKVVANKVRIRAKPDIEGHIIRQVNKNELLLVVGEVGDFYAIEPMKDTKAYVFRSYILDNVVEANRVNVRLEPHVDAPIIGQLSAGDKISGTVCNLNHKWLEIQPPKGLKLYVSKEFVSQVGGPEYLASMQKRKSQVEELLSAAYLNAETECKKSYEEMSPHQAVDQFQTILRNFADFPESVTQAKEGLALLKETYLNKKIAYLESRAELSEPAKKELLEKHRAENSELFADASPSVDPGLWNKRSHKKDSFSVWDTLEESLFLSWTAFHSGKKVDDFYAEQKANANVLRGSIELYDYDVKNKPGEYILRGADSPLAYLYSTQVDLEKFVGKQVTVLVSPRPNNHFAFPAYFVLGVE